MGTHGTGLFQCDLAATIRADYPTYLRAGMTGRRATNQVLVDWADELEDEFQDGPVVWLALAVTQWNYGRLEPRVKRNALKAIKKGADVETFPPNLRPQRVKELEKIRRIIESPQPPEKPVRIRTPPKPLKKIEQHWQSGQVVAYRLNSGEYVLLATQGICLHDYMGQLPQFLMLKWRGKRIPSAKRIAKLRPIKFAMGGYPNLKGEPIPWDRIERLDAVHEPIGYMKVSDDGVYCAGGLHDFRWKEFEKFLGENEVHLR